MIMPNFLVFGAAKSGTTSVYKYLQQHPDILMSSFKEPGFFAFEGEHPILNGPGAQKWVDRWVVSDLAAYQELFANYQGEKAIGDASPYYIYYEKTPHTIKKYAPEMKLIAILREPVDRAFSNYVWALRDRAESLTDFAEALAVEESRIKDNWGPKWHYKNQGFYYQQLKPYYDMFPREQIKIYLYDDLVGDSVKVMQDIFTFLEVDANFQPNMSKRHNTSKLTRNQAWQKFLDKPNIFKSAIKPFLSEKFRQNIKQNAKEKNSYKPKLDENLRQELKVEYRDNIVQLQDLIQQDLSLWLED
jgi:Sulfotransferase family